MPIDLRRLVDVLNPENTVLLFGAGSSIPSRAPSAAQLATRLAQKFGIPSKDYSFTEVASIVEERNSRRELVAAIRSIFKSIKPTGGLLNLPLYDWKSIYTTNYDELIEKCYEHHGRELNVYSSNFDFTMKDKLLSTKLFKLHGSVEKDICDGHVSRLIITDADYEHTNEYREFLFDRLRSDLAGSQLLIVGHSLGDEHIREIANRAAKLNVAAKDGSKIYLLMYERDDNRARLFENRHFLVCFGGLNDFIAEFARKLPERAEPQISTDPLDLVPALRPTTIDVTHASGAGADVSAMFNGWPATHADILAGLTFDRTVGGRIEEYLNSEGAKCVVLLGASGVGKTTAGRQVLQRLRLQRFLCWEHQYDFQLNAKAWLAIAKHLALSGQRGVLLIDEAHSHLQQINDLVDALAGEEVYALKLMFVSARNHWYPRIKSPFIYKAGREFKLQKLDPQEIDNLLLLVDRNNDIRSLVEQTFSGFSDYERRRRLVDRCASETFVCLKNIFASDKFDDIILREYAALDPIYQEIYRHVAAMESSGIRVHRQLVIRLLGISPDQISAALTNLEDIVHEYTINEREGLYGWRGRHPVIVLIIAQYKYPDLAKRIELFSKVIDSISPTYDIEVRTIIELCNVESGIGSIPDKSIQNTLLRKMMSVVPGERVPRHRLIRNLIEMGEFEKAETEIRIFEKDFRSDGPVTRYKVTLLTARATKSYGLLLEDRVAILEKARGLASNSIRKYPNNKTLLAAYCDVGIEIYRRTGNRDAYDAAIAELRASEERIGDPDVSRMIGRYARRIHEQPADVVGMAIADDELSVDEDNGDDAV